MRNNIIRHGIYRGDIYWGEEIYIDGITMGNKIRPYLVISSWKNNIKSPLVNVVPLTRQEKLKEKNCVKIKYDDGNKGIILCSQILTIPKNKLLDTKIMTVKDDIMIEVDKCLRSQLYIEQFDIKYVKKSVCEILELRDFINKNNLYSDRELKVELHTQEIVLQKYCEKYEENYNDYLKLGELQWK